MTTKENGVRLSERIIPVPRSISAEAQAFLANPWPSPGAYPPLADKAAWRSYIAQANAGLMKQLEPLRAVLPATSQAMHLAGVPTYFAKPKDLPRSHDDKAVLDIHGGGLVLLGGECVELFGLMSAATLGFPVFAIDYRNPPDHPYPAALDDCMAAYKALLDRYGPGKIAITGSSGGGNLAAALALRIRDEGLPFPSSLMLMTPELDLTESGDTFQTNRDIDIVLKKGLPELNALYANGQDLAHPYLSPLFGDFTRGYPPTFIQTGTRDIFLSNCVRMNRALRAAKIAVELHIFEAMPHGGFGGMTPEDQEVREERIRFLNAHWR